MIFLQSTTSQLDTRRATSPWSYWHHGFSFLITQVIRGLMQQQLAMFIQNTQVGVRSSKSGRPPWSTLRAFYLSPNRCKLTNAASLRTKSWQRFIKDWIRTCVEPLARRNVVDSAMAWQDYRTLPPKVMFAKRVNIMSIWWKHFLISCP